MDRDIAITIADALGDIKDVLDDILEVLTPADDSQPADNQGGT